MARALKDIRLDEYQARLEVMALRRAVYEEMDDNRRDELAAAEARLEALSDERGDVEKEATEAGDTLSAGLKLLGAATTKLDAKADLRMAYVPTALVHLFDAPTNPLVELKVENVDQKTRRLGFISYVEGYSARAVDTVEIQQGQTLSVLHLPTFFPDAIRSVNEMTRATVNIEILDLDAKTELHKTMPVWLAPRTTAPLSVLDPASGKWQDMTRYLGAFVTPNAPRVLSFLHDVTDVHPDHQLIGYQINKTKVEPQVKAVFDALKAHKIRYVNSVIEFTRESGTRNQRVRLPRETLDDKQANCIDGTLVVASLLEAMSLNPAIVIIPGHAFVAWETWHAAPAPSGDWNYLETTMIADAEFADARKRGEDQAKFWQAKANAEAKPKLFRRLALSDLRASGITPLE